MFFLSIFPLLAEGVPHWEVEKEAHFELRDDTCIVFLKQFCWVTYKVDNEVVEGKKLQIFTAGKPLVETDCEGTVEVGYYLDLPGKGNVSIYTITFTNGCLYIHRIPFYAVGAIELFICSVV